ncbi:MAG: hypothetical protein U9P07_01660 [Pseudomonadota bacterium]|nr:hypothetical protein [Pseudomonadota bacterium]
MSPQKRDMHGSFFLIHQCHYGKNCFMVDKKNDQKKALRKYRLLKTINKFMVWIGVLFILYVAYAYIIYFYTLSQAR